MPDLPTSASVVIIGGGVVGCSVAYHLTKLGWKDVVLLERKQLTSGTTWHAAGLIAQLRATANMTKLAQVFAGTLRQSRSRNRRRHRVQAGRVDHRRADQERLEELYRQAGDGPRLWRRVEEISPKRSRIATSISTSTM